MLFLQSSKKRRRTADWRATWYKNILPQWCSERTLTRNRTMSNSKAVNEIIAIQDYISKHAGDQSLQMSELSKWLDNLRIELTTKTTVWLAVDNEGTEIIFQSKPKRGRFFNLWVPKEDREGFSITVPQGTIKKLIGRDLTWDDEPVEYK